MPAEIPGFYYDRAKGKYFRITPDHKAFSSAAKYSASSIAIFEDAQEAAIHQEAKAFRVSREYIKRATIPTVLAREIGVINAINGYVPSLGASGYSLLKSSQEINSCNCIGATSAVSRRSRYLSRITALARHGPTATIFIGHDRPGDLWQYSEHFNAKTCVHHFAVEISSLLVHDASSTVVAVLGQGDVLTYQISQDKYHGALGNSIIRRMSDTCYAAALCPDSGRCIVAVASKSPYTIDVSTPYTVGYVGYSGRGRKGKPWKPSDALDVQWQDVNVLAFALRNGSITLQDTRDASSSVQRIIHPSAACHIRYANASVPQILVAGLENKMCLYDLRYCKLTHTASSPWLEFPYYENKAIPDLGCDIEPYLGLVAAGSDKGGVKLMDLWKGTIVEHPAQMERNGSDARVSCIVFDRAGDGERHYGYCLVGRDSHLERWSLGQGIMSKEQESLE